MVPRGLLRLLFARFDRPNAGAPRATSAAFFDPELRQSCDYVRAKKYT